MIIKDHAVRRYRKRAGTKRMSKQRVLRDIHRQISKHASSRKYDKQTGQYRITTPKFTAVCEGNRVITILYPTDVPENLPKQTRR